MAEPTDFDAAIAQGRKEGMATAALAIGALSFVNLLGAEKGLLAVVLGFLAVSGSQLARGRGRIAIGLGGLQICTIILVLFVFHEKIAQLVALLSKLG